MFLRLRRILALLCLAVAASCATTGADRPPLHPDHVPGTWYTVARGDTPASIAQRAGIPLEDLLEINGLRQNDQLEPGRTVFLYGTTKGMTSEPTPEAPSAQESMPAAQPAADGKAIFRWPLTHPRVTSRFGKRWGRLHEGVDMAAPIGTPVLAAAEGEVIYSGDQVRGYGNMVVLKHKAGLVTVYAHNSVLLVRRGDRVTVGQEIARVGDTGRSTAPHLHFEVRRKDVPVDPVPFLPALQ